MNTKKIFCIILTSLFLPLSCSAVQPFDVVINEICWMGTEVSANDEWIELYNNTGAEIDLKGWKLIAKDGTPDIGLKGKIRPQGFFILERTDNESAANVEADQIYTGALSNEGECLRLIDDQGNVVDEADCGDDWFGGDNQTKQTMERINSRLAGNNQENWQTSQEPGGTPKSVNGSEVGPRVAPAAEVRPRPTSYPEGIIINEVLPSPEGPDAENEYIEIFNKNDFSVDISGWLIQDVEGQTTSFAFPTRTIIEAQGFLVFFRTQTKITLNNSGDGLKLYNPGNELVDEVFYDKAGLAESYNRMGDEWVWSTNLTPGTTNIVPEEKSDSYKIGYPESENEGEQEIAQKKEGLIESLSANMAQSGLAPRFSESFWPVLLSGLLVAGVSCVLIMVLKRKIKSRS